MAAIDIGPGAIDRNATRGAGYTLIQIDNPANDTGWLTTFEVWAKTDASGVKIGTFSGSGTSYDDRDYETIGNVTAGSKQTFSGLNCDVVTGDFLGVFFTGGTLEGSDSGEAGVYYKAGDQFGTGAQTYTLQAGFEDSIYGTAVAPPQTLSPSSIVQTIAYGTPKLILTIQPSSIVQPIAYGTPQLILTIQPSSIVQAISIGTPTIICPQTLSPTGINQPIAYGTPAISYPQTLLPSSIIQAISIGTPTIFCPQTLLPSSIAQAVAIGTPIITKPDLYESYTEENAYYNVYGAYWRSQSFTPQSSHKITSVKLKLCRVGSPGTGTISIKATDGEGKPTGADLCSASIDGNALPTDPTLLGFSLGAGTNLSAGTKYAIVWRFPSGDSSNYARTRHMYPGTYAGGTAVTSSDSGATWEVVTDWDFVFQDWGESLAQTVYPDSTVQPVTYGTPDVSIYGLILPTSIVQQVIIGTPDIIKHGLILPTSIVQEITYGAPSVYRAQTIYPSSIIQYIVIGSPTIPKYVWHVILDGQYLTATPPTNRAYVIGRDVYGNPVYGTAVDSTELGLVGERLDFQQELAIPTESQAADVANAILAKMRLTGKRGVILIPPNCGQELFDVVQISDAGANQSAVKFRVVGLRFEYHPKQARYQHRLILGAP